MSRSLFVKRLPSMAGFTCALLAAGTVGLLQLPGWSVSDALWMSVITSTAALPRKTGLIVIAITHGGARDEGRLFYHPGSEERIRPGDALITHGSPDQVDGLRTIVSP